MLRLRSIARIFPPLEAPVHALRDVDLEVEPGAFLSIEGPSGGGKSTLLNVIGLLDTPTAGTYSIFGESTKNLSDLERTRLRSAHFAFVFQGFHLLDARPVLDSVELALMYRGVERGARRSAAIAALEAVGLGARVDHLARNLSGGERQRVAIARALASRPRIVVADEPTGNLDSANGEMIAKLLQEIHAAGTTVVLVTHSPGLAAIASTHVHIRDGVLVRGDSNGAPPKSQGGSETDKPVAVGRPTELIGHPTRLRSFDLLRDAAASLGSRRARTLGLALTVGLGVGMAIGTTGVSSSASSQVTAAFDAHANRDVTVTWTQSEVKDDVSGAIAERLSELSAVEAVATLDDYGATLVQAVANRPTFEVDAFGVDGDIAAAARLTVDWNFSSGSTLNDGAVLIGQSLADQLELGSIGTSPSIMVNNVTFPVAGYVTASPRVPDLLGAIIRTADAEAPAIRTRALILAVTGGSQQAAEQAPLAIDPFNPGALVVEAPVDPQSLRSQVQGDIQITLIVLTVLAVLASVIALTNAMVVAVLERANEFGLRRAVGARARHIAGLVISESVMIGAAGGLAGLVTGLVGILIVTISQGWRPVLDVGLAPLALAGGVVVGALSGAAAAIRASRIAPADALRS